jgi:hypothetical protein
MSNKKSSQFTDTDYVVKPVEEPEEFPKESFPGFDIEEVAIPKRTGRKPVNVYPIDKLEAGSTQSFLVPSKPDEFKNNNIRVRTYAYKHGFKVILRNEENGVRVWRKQ